MSYVSPYPGSVFDVKVTGATPVCYLSAASTNATLVKNSPGVITSITIINTTATLYYFKLYNTNFLPVAGASAPVQCYPVPASATGNGLTVNLPGGLAFNVGIGFTLVGGIAHSDASNAATGVVINIGYA